LFYKEKTDSEFLFWAINQLKTNKEFFIQKAIGWSLRQYHRVAPEKVEAFVEASGITGLAKKEALKHAG
jgi:3-methyladenine DNA glycosylase AlkD